MKNKFTNALSLISAVAAVAFATGAVGVSQEAYAQTAPVTIYADGMQSGWQNWSWAKVDLQAKSPDGSTAISVDSGAYQALFLHIDAFNVKSFTALTFKLHGGSSGGQRLKVLALVNGKPLDRGTYITATKDKWEDVTIDLAGLAIPSETIEGFWIMNESGEPIPTFYVKSIALK